MRDALVMEARARRLVALVVLLAVVVVVAAGISGPAHLTGPRWYPHFKHSHTKSTAVTQTITSPKLLGSSKLPSGSGLPLWVVLVVVVGVVLAVLAWLLVRWLRQRPPATAAGLRTADQLSALAVPEPEPEPDPPVLLSGLELALQTLDEQRDPTDAIVRAWLGLQETAAESGIVRRASETATEFTSRILNQAFADDAAIHTLLRLYLRTRFGDHPVTADDVAAVRAALTELVESWHSDHVAEGG